MVSETSPSDEVLLEALRRIIAKSLKIDPASISEDSYLDDLGAESLDLIEINFECDDQFQVLMPEKTILDIAERVFGPGVLFKDGFLTEEGKRFLQRRMPEFDVSKYDGPVPLADVQKGFLQVSAWVRMIRGLIEANPRVCTRCGTALATATHSRRSCPGCGAQYELLPGEAVNRAWVEDYYQRDYLPAISSGSLDPAQPSGQ